MHYEWIDLLYISVPSIVAFLSGLQYKNKVIQKEKNNIKNTNDYKLYEFLLNIGKYEYYLGENSYLDQVMEYVIQAKQLQYIELHEKTIPATIYTIAKKVSFYRLTENGELFVATFSQKLNEIK